MLKMGEGHTLHSMDPITDQGGPLFLWHQAQLTLIAATQALTPKNEADMGQPELLFLIQCDKTDGPMSCREGSKRSRNRENNIFYLPVVTQLI